MILYFIEEDLTKTNHSPTYHSDALATRLSSISYKTTGYYRRSEAFRPHFTMGVALSVLLIIDL